MIIYEVKTLHLTKVIAILHYTFYGFFMIPVVMNAEAWFFGFKISRVPDKVIVFSIGISGLIICYFIFKQKRMARFVASFNYYNHN